MKYIIKTPVEAIQWNGDNQNEVYDFIIKTAKECYSLGYLSGDLDIVYIDLRGRKFETVLPKYGWIVRDGKTFQFYKNKTFHKTFEEVPDDDSKAIIDAILKDAEDCINAKLKGKSTPFMDNLYKAIFDNPSQSAFAKYDNLINPNGRLTKLIDDLYKDDEKTREEIKKNLSEGLKDMEDSDETKGTEFDTFESVLDEMKELHAKKNKDYGDAAHVNFLKYGPIASLSRLSEKMQRAEHILLSGKCEVKDEPLTSTLIDIAITSAMLYMELKNKDNG